VGEVEGMSVEAKRDERKVHSGVSPPFSSKYLMCLSFGEVSVSFSGKLAGVTVWQPL